MTIITRVLLALTAGLAALLVLAPAASAVSTVTPLVNAAIVVDLPSPSPGPSPGFNETPMNPGVQTGPWPGAGGHEFPCDPNAPFNICN